MRRIVAALTLSGLASSLGSAAGDDNPPPLTPPVLQSPIAEAPSELPPFGGATALPDRGAVLVVPGYNTPRPGARAARPTTRAATPLEADPLPPLVGPAEMPAPIQNETSGSPRSSSRRPETRQGNSRTPPPIIESTPSSPNSRDEDPKKTVEPDSRRGSLGTGRLALPPMRRPQGLFGRLFPPAAGIERGGRDLNDAVTVEPRTDPESDALVKRRVERQIRDGVGKSLRSYEVNVSGRDVTIRARASRFWQKRAMRHSLETLPILSGYNAHVDMVD